MAAETQLKDMSRDFHKVKAAADTFVQWTNNQTQEQNEDTELEAGEMCRGGAVTDAETSFEIDVHNQIMDTVLERIHQQLLKNGTLYADLALLDPKNFNQVTTYAGGFPEAALQQLSKCLLPFDDRATVANLQSENRSGRTVDTPIFEYTSKATEDGPEGAEDELKMVYKKY